MARIFISHCEKDKEDVDMFFDLLQTGCDIQRKEIFCTSIEGAGIKTGSDFLKWIKDYLKKTQLVILFVIPNYLHSNFCIAEMGASWALGMDVYPILMYGMDAEIGGVFLGKQTAYFDEKGLDELRDQLGRMFTDIEMSTARWSSKKGQFLKNMKKKQNESAINEVIKEEELGEKEVEIVQQKKVDKFGDIMKILGGLLEPSNVDSFIMVFNDAGKNLEVDILQDIRNGLSSIGLRFTHLKSDDLITLRDNLVDIIRDIEKVCKKFNKHLKGDEGYNREEMESLIINYDIFIGYLNAFYQVEVWRNPKFHPLRCLLKNRGC